MLTPASISIRTAALVIQACLLCSLGMLQNARAENTRPADARTYDVDYIVQLDPGAGTADVQVRLTQNVPLVRWLRFHIDPKRHTDLHADGDLSHDEPDYALWTPPEGGGSLWLTVRIDHRRSSNGYDAKITDSWAILRGDDLVPPARVRTLKGARSRATLRVLAPEDWSVYSPYPRAENGSFEVEQEGRRFDRPVGWLIAGELGARRDTIDDIHVVVAAPVGQGVHRQDMLAFLNWNLPEVARVFPGFPQRLLIVSAGDPMWRGALSASNSLYVHAERPLISANGTSTLVHELVHVAMGLRGANGADWIVEGFAEYYSVEMMRRSGSITERRFDKTMRHLAEWGSKARTLTVADSSGAVTARAVVLLHELDRELRELSNGQANLDDVARELVARDDEISLNDLREIAEGVAGQRLQALASDVVPVL